MEHVVADPVLAPENKQGLACVVNCVGARRPSTEVSRPLGLGHAEEGTVAKLAMRQPFVLFKGLTFQKL
ncbi:hypothetical protein FA101_31595, partial [Pseudomonas aeruginosa]|nr:hypothetical protein [Pseudomonas aeruginosa]